MYPLLKCLHLLDKIKMIAPGTTVPPFINFGVATHQRYISLVTEIAVGLCIAVSIVVLRPFVR
jgi:hypothetical protein